MKTIIAFISCIAIVAAGTIPVQVPGYYKSDNTQYPEAQIVQYQNDNNGVGPYNFA